MGLTEIVYYRDNQSALKHQYAIKPSSNCTVRIVFLPNCKYNPGPKKGLPIENKHYAGNLIIYKSKEMQVSGK